MNLTLLHALAQRPKLTGSGTTLDAFATEAAKEGWNQHAVVGVPKGASFKVEGVEEGKVHPLFFERGELNFPVPGMSDVMPYRSTRFSSMSEEQLEAYRGAWRNHLEEVVHRVKPDIILSHHIWILSSLLKDVAPSIPVVTQCHATGLRQMELCPHLADEVIRGCARNDGFTVLRKDHALELCRVLGVKQSSVHVVGAGYNRELFHARGRVESAGSKIIYVGKLSAAKGLPCLLDAVESLVSKGIHLELNVAGSGEGEDAEEIKKRFGELRGVLKYHGQLNQSSLAKLMRECDVCALPSFYEGVPLVLVEAFACGCRIVSTALPGVLSELYPHLGDAIDVVPLPRLIGVDTPHPDDLPEFASNLSASIEKAISLGPLKLDSAERRRRCDYFSWSAVFGRVRKVLLGVLESG